MTDQQPISQDTAQNARALEEHGNNMKVPPHQRHQAIKQAQSLRARQEA